MTAQRSGVLPQSGSTAIDEDDLASDIAGRNGLQGDDQAAVRNQRRLAPQDRRENESVLDSLRLLDRAQEG